VVLLAPEGDYPVKTRYLDGDRLVLRLDEEAARYRDGDAFRERALRVLREQSWGALYVADYAKGALGDAFVAKVVRACRDRGTPCVADLKRPPGCARGAVLKCNGDYALRHPVIDHPPACVVTYASQPPHVFDEQGYDDCDEGLPPVACRNHVGAGDCFGVHLALALACNVPLRRAARFAHSAGRVYVQHPHSRPPWPHEVRKDMAPASGKVLAPLEAERLRASLAGKKLVFTNGIFRVPHAGHCWLLRWAKAQGDVLAVGVNTDNTAAVLRPGLHVRPLAERLEWLCGLACVDWVFPFSDPTPAVLVESLQPDLLVKGHEYAGQQVPGHDSAKEVRFAPESPFPLHSTTLVEELRT
jgi:D-beta-D-heptose 7-phosphate kinase/D-beta-D-heptose 1-phosphate adenosyltransferase